MVEVGETREYSLHLALKEGRRRLKGQENLGASCERMRSTRLL